MKRKKYIVLLWGLTVFVMLLNISCSPSSNSLYETFYVGDEGIQYYIRPLSFTGTDDSELQMDFTLRYRTVIKDSSIINLTIISDKAYKSLDSIVIKNDSANVVMKNFSTMYIERSGNNFSSRFTTRTALKDFKTLFTNSTWSVSTYASDTLNIFTARNKTRDKINKLYFSIFSTF